MMTRTLNTISILGFTTLLSCFLWLIPDVANAQLVPCNGPDCTSCSVLQLGNNILSWLLGVLFAVFAVVAFSAGWGLATSGGNQVELDKAKNRMTNAVIGIVVVLAGWLIVDAVMTGLLSGGNLGSFSGFGPWSQVTCDAAMVTPSP